MRHSAIVYQTRLQHTLQEARLHIARMQVALEELQKKYRFPLDPAQFVSIVNDRIDLAFADQAIYRFSKAQDTLGAKLFKDFLLYHGENVDQPFLDILNRLEKLGIVNVEQWFILREIRNHIAHEYENLTNQTYGILNDIVSYHKSLQEILEKIESMIVVRGE